MKFVKSLAQSNDKIKEARAQMLADDTLLEVDTLISNLKRKVNSLKSTINNLTDLAPDNTYSLRPGGKDYNPLKWVTELHQATLDLKIAEIEYDAAVSIKTEWFTNE